MNWPQFPPGRNGGRERGKSPVGDSKTDRRAVSRWRAPATSASAKSRAESHKRRGRRSKKKRGESRLFAERGRN